MRETVGTFACLCCGDAIPAKVGSGGAVSVSCPWCDLSAYAKPGTLAYKSIMGRVKRAAVPDAEKPAEKPAAEVAQQKSAPSARKGAGLLMG